MRICDNGVYRDMTAEEIAELEEETKKNPPIETDAEMGEILNVLLGGNDE